MLHHMRIHLKIGMIIAILGLISLIIGSIGVLGLKSLSNETIAVNKAGNTIRTGSRANQSLLAINEALYHLAAAPFDAKETSPQLSQSMDQFQSRLSQIETDTDGKYTDRIKEIQQDFGHFRQTAETSATMASDLSATTTPDSLTPDQIKLLASVKEATALQKKIKPKITALGDSLVADNEAIITQATQMAEDLTLWMVLIAVGGLVVGIVGGWVIARVGMVKPMARIVQDLEQLANANLDIEIYGTDHRDEIGLIAKAAQTLRDNARQAEIFRAEQAHDQEQRLKRNTMIVNLTDQFDSQASQTIDTVANAAIQLHKSASDLSGSAEQSSQQATMVAKAATQASSNVQTVASAAEELTASISEISNQVTQSTEVLREAVSQAAHTSDIVRTMQQSSQQIGEVVTMIAGIAEQTNLLALNGGCPARC